MTIPAIPPSAPISWGSIPGTLSNQADLKAALQRASENIESRYTKALLFAPPPRQANHVPSFGDPLWGADYLGGMTDAQLYDTNPGYLTTGADTSKALFVYSAIANDAVDGLANIIGGGAILVQHSFILPSLTAQVELFGNQKPGSNNTGGIYAFVTTAGQLNIGFGTVGVYGGSQITYAGLVTATLYNITVLFDGASRTYHLWVNGNPSPFDLQTYALLPNTGTSIPAGTLSNGGQGGSHFGIGVAMAASTAVSTAQPLQTKAFRLSSVPSGVSFKSPGLLDNRFNRSQFVIFNDYDLVGVQ